MKKVVLSFCFALLAGCSGTNEHAPLLSDQRNQIFGGDLAVNSNYSSYAALFVYRTSEGEFTCTATPITSRHLLVSAHCVENASQMRLLFFASEVTGIVIKTWPQEYTRTVESRNVAVHPQFQMTRSKSKGNPNDIAILQLNEPMPDGMKTFYLNPRPIRLATDPRDVGLLGYGFEKLIRRPNGKKEFVGRALFRFATQTMKPGGQAKMFLLDGHNGQGSCVGDSGGPVFYEREDHSYLLVGLTSQRLTDPTQADECAVDSEALDVSYHFNWILQTIEYLKQQPSS